MFIFRFLSKLLIKYLTRPSSSVAGPTCSLEFLQKTIQRGDVLLVEGKEHFSTAVKYLTQSNWSHSAIYIGDGKLIEADLELGVIEIPLSKYKDFHTRICRSKGLSEEQMDEVINYVKGRLGHTYDMKNIFDLLRYLFPTPPIPTSWRRSVLSFGSGDPTKAICSSLIALAFQRVRYPILPVVVDKDGKSVRQVRYHALFTPSDFDRSPFFDVVKPSMIQGAKVSDIIWSNVPDIEVRGNEQPIRKPARKKK